LDTVAILGPAAIATQDAAEDMFAIDHVELARVQVARDCAGRRRNLAGVSRHSRHVVGLERGLETRAPWLGKFGRPRSSRLCWWQRPQMRRIILHDNMLRSLNSADRRGDGGSASDAASS
jgi:hypothetical protein